MEYYKMYGIFAKYFLTLFNNKIFREEFKVLQAATYIAY